MPTTSSEAEGFTTISAPARASISLGGTVAQLSAGPRMHVLCEYDGWLYVCVPRNEPGWLMDVDGQYGFVKTADVRTAASFVQLDWRMESSDQ